MIANHRDLQAATVRLARALVAEADGASILGLCQGPECGAVMAQDLFVPNSGRGYLCPACADKEIAQLRRRVAELEKQLKIEQKATREAEERAFMERPWE